MRSPSGFHTILVPVDGSAAAEQAIPTAVAIAKCTRGRIKLVLVHQQLQPLHFLEPGEVYTRTLLAIEKADREYMTALVKRMRAETGWSFTSALLRGPIASTLAGYTRDIGADLMVMTTHGHGGLRRAWLGSVSDALARSLDIPLILVRPGEKGTEPQPSGFDEIVVPLDGSPLAEAALEPATALAGACSAEITLVQVVRPVPLATDPPLPFPTGYADRETQIQQEAAEDYLEDIANRIRESGLKAAVQVVIGDRVADTLLDILRPGRLAAIATHGQGGLRRLVLGSVADKLIRAAEVPVMVVRPRAVRQRTSRTGTKAGTRSLASVAF